MEANTQNFTPPLSRDDDDVESKALSVPDQARAIEVIDKESFEKAGRLLVVIKGIQKEIDDTFDPIVRKAHEAHKEAVSQKKRVSAPLLEAEAIIKPRMVKYHQAIEAKRQEEERRAQEEARKKAEEEKLQQALAAESEGYAEEAEAILDAPVIATRVVTPTQAVKVAGVSFRETWKAEVFDLRALARAVADGKVPLAAIQADRVFLNRQAVSLKAEMQYPGVKVFKETNAAGTGRKI